MEDTPLAFFITFTTYGTWLHGDERGSIIRKDGTTTLLSGQENLINHERHKRKSSSLLLSSSQRKVVLKVIIDHCKIRHWKLLAAHVRSNHVHIVVKSDKQINHTAKEFKAWSTRMLRGDGLTRDKVWTSGSSRKYIFKQAKLFEKVHYVAYEQGEMMECYVDKSFAK